MKFARRPGRPGLIAWVCVAAVLALLAGALGQPRKGGTDTRPGETPNASVKMTRPGTFTISVRGAKLRSVLQLLSMQSEENIVATKEVIGDVTADLRNVTFDEALEAVLHSAGFVHRRKGKIVYIYTKEQLAAILKAEQKVVVKSFRLHFITPVDAKELLTPFLSADGKMSTTPAAAVGIAESSTDAGGNAYATTDLLIVKDYEEIVKKIAEVIAEVDIKPDQVLIEATILRARLNETNSLGVDFTTVCGIDFEGLSSTTGLAGVTTGTLSGADVDTKAHRFRTDFSASVPAGGMTFGLISNNIAMLVRALESITDVTVLANPKLLVVNKQRGEVMVGNRDGYLTTTFTETTATQTVEFLETGTRLLVRPFVCTDGYVRLEIHPEDSSGSVEQIGESALPQESTTEVTSNVLVKDGHTIVIGGLFREDTTSGRAQLPIIGNVPYLGSLFRSTTDTTVREEVIILITPRIIKQANDSAVSEQILEKIERLRIGARKGVRWWGRSRLAQVAARKARVALRTGDRGKALWYTDVALSFDPRLVAGIQLREALTERAYWADHQRNTTVRYVIQRMIMQELGKPIEYIIPPDKPVDEDKIDSAVRKAFGIIKHPPPPLVIRARPVYKRPPALPAKTPVRKPPPLPTKRPVLRPVPVTPPPAKPTPTPPSKMAAPRPEMEVKEQAKPSDQDSGGNAPSTPPSPAKPAPQPAEAQ